MPHRRLIFALLFAALIAAPAATFAQEEANSSEPNDAAEEAEAPEAQPASAAEEWLESFGAESTLTHFRRGEDAAVIVVAAGEHPQVELAADTLEESLRESDAFHLVMNDDPLADNSQADDQRIIEKAKYLPVGQVAVVRVYAGASGKPPTAVVTIYDKQTGQVAAAISVTRGAQPKVSQPPAADTKPAEPSPAERGADEAAERGADEAAKVVAAARRAVDPTRRKYRARYIWFDNEGDEDELSQWTRVYRGDQRESLRGEAFYREIGRPELAEEYETQSLLKWSAVGGLAVAGAGAAALIAFTGEPGDEARVALAGAAGGALFGSAVLVGALYNPHPIELDEAKQLARDHNQKLRDDLGLSQEVAAEQTSSLEWSVGLTGAGAALRVEF